MATAIKMVTDTLDADCDILVYHSGERKYTRAIETKIGIPKSMAIGKPLLNLLRKPLCSSLTRSQCSRNLISFSESIRKITGNQCKSL